MEWSSIDHDFVAERGRFELPEPVKVQRFSRPPQSTTLPPLRDKTIVATRRVVSSKRALDRLANQFDVNRNIDFVSHYKPATLEHGIPGQAEVFALDPRTGAGAKPQPSFRILNLRCDGIHVKCYLTGDAADGQVSGDLVAVQSGRNDLRGCEGYLRIPAYVQEVMTFEVAVALGLAGINARGVDRRLHVRGGEVRGIELDRARDTAELALYV